MATTLDDARALHRAGELDAALDAYREVISAARDSAQVGTAYNNACVLLMNRGQYRDALQACEAASELRERTDDLRGLGRTLNNLALVHQSLGQYAEAEAGYSRALAINEARDDAPAQAVNLANLGLLATLRAQYTRAIARHDQVIALAARHRDEPWAAEQTRVANVNTGVVLEKLGAYREALALYRDVLRDGDSLAPSHRASLQVNLGVVYRNLGDPISALRAFEDAIDTQATLEDTAALSNAYLNVGLVEHLDLANATGAEAAYRRALELARESGDRNELIQDLFYLGRLLLDGTRLDEARAAFEECLRESLESDSPEGRWSALDGLGRVAAQSGEVGKALDYFRRAMAEIETVRGELHSTTRRAGYFGDKRGVFEASISALMRLHDTNPDDAYTDEVFLVVQRAKARALLDTLGTSGRVAQPLDRASVQAQLGRELMIEYFIADGQLWRLGLSRDAFDIHDLGPAAPVLAQATELLDALAHARPLPPSAAPLGATLLGEMAQDLQRFDRIHFAPDRMLHYVPFAALALQSWSGQPIVTRIATSYLPSASTLPALRDRQYAGTVDLVGFANPTLPATGRDPGPAGLLASRLQLEPLLGAESELQRIGRWVGGEQSLIAGADATEARLREAAAHGTRILHLATHAIVDDTPGAGGAILLSAAGEDDGLLYPEEIAAIPMRTQLTVLAACRTAAGGAQPGFALGTLSGSLLAAGTSGVIATLWDVDDTTTAAFMEQLYYHLGRGQTASAALRDAQLTMRADPRWAAAHVWAPYVLIGEARPLDASPRAFRYVLWSGGLLAVFALLAAFRRRSDQRNSRTSAS